METVTTTPSRSAVIQRRDRGLIVAVVILGLLVLVLGGWLLADRYVDSDVERFLHEYVADWEAGDGPAVSSMFAEDGELVDSNGSYSGERIAEVVETAGADGFHLQQIGEPSIIQETVGEITRYLVVSHDRVGFGDGAATEGFDSYYLYELRGQFHIIRHEWNTLA